MLQHIFLEALEPFIPFHPRLTGSRLFGGTRYDSDWDFYLEENDALPLTKNWKEEEPSKYLDNSFVARIFEYSPDESFWSLKNSYEQIHLILCKRGTLSLFDRVHVAFYKTGFLRGRNKRERKEYFTKALALAEQYPLLKTIKYRCFRFAYQKAGSWFSINYSFSWKIDKWKMALCLCQRRGKRNASMHFALSQEEQEKEGSCGFYFFHDVVHAYVYQAGIFPLPVLGQIEIRGIIQVHALGGRASEARLLKIIPGEEIS